MMGDQCQVCEGSGRMLCRGGGTRGCYHCNSTGIEPPYVQTGNQTAVNLLIAQQMGLRACQKLREQRTPPEYAI